MLFTKVAKALAYVLIAIGAWAVFEGARLSFEIGPVGETFGWPLVPGARLLGQGFLLVCLGVAMGALSEISAALHRSIPKTGNAG